jgi:hypothetical protein
MSKTRSEVLQESTRKGVVASAATAATVAAGALAVWPLAVVGAPVSAYLGWKWWKHRAENGIRF